MKRFLGFTSENRAKESFGVPHFARRFSPHLAPSSKIMLARGAMKGLNLAAKKGP